MPSGDPNNTTVMGTVALSGTCPYCGTIQTDRGMNDYFIRFGGQKEFLCMKCTAKFTVKWTGLSGVVPT